MAFPSKLITFFPRRFCSLPTKNRLRYIKIMRNFLASIGSFSHCRALKQTKINQEQGSFVRVYIYTYSGGTYTIFYLRASRPKTVNGVRQLSYKDKTSSLSSRRKTKREARVYNTSTSFVSVFFFVSVSTESVSQLRQRVIPYACNAL